MKITLCRLIISAKITDKLYNYTGRIFIGENIIKSTGLYPFEKIKIINCTTGKEFEFIVDVDQGNKITVCNGSSDNFVISDKILIHAFAEVTNSELNVFSLLDIKLDSNNIIIDSVKKELRELI